MIMPINGSIFDFLIGPSPQLAALRMKQEQQQREGDAYQKLMDILQSPNPVAQASAPRVTPDTSFADLNTVANLGAATPQPKSLDQLLPAIFGIGRAGGNLGDVAAAIKALSPEPITPYQRAQLDLTKGGQEEQGRRFDIQQVDQASRDVENALERSEQRRFQGQQGDLNRRNAMDIAQLRSSVQLGSAGNVQSVQPIQLPNGQAGFVKVFRDGRTETVDLNDKPVVNSKYDADALFRQSAARSGGEAAGKFAESFPTVQANFKVINDALDSFEDPTVKKQAPFALGVGGLAPPLPGVNTDFLTRLAQLKGQTFLQAYNTLRGGGQITEVEGSKATDAIARLSRAQTETEFYKALDDARVTFRDIYEASRARALRGSVLPNMGPTPEPAPGHVPASAPARKTGNPLVDKYLQ